MKVIEKSESRSFPYPWVDVDYLPGSKGKKVEVYLRNNNDQISELILLFYILFSNVKAGIKIYNFSWWDYCLDTWNHNKGEYDYSILNKSDETKEYLLLLKGSSIGVGYSGSCRCLNWDRFLNVSLKCLLSHIAPYSHLFYDEKDNFFFYFHHTGSIGFYYEEKNKIVKDILQIAKSEYDIR
ncbi:MAG: hypothetical protein KF862_08685 [Chitinophagaceae bacterium]|nr:hypothetical protein [Chitinophagaceae bacterium]